MTMSERLEDIAIKMVAEGKGILAADESTSTIKKRFDAEGINFAFPSRTVHLKQDSEWRVTANGDAKK